jgi:hypothetical protein
MMRNEYDLQDIRDERETHTHKSQEGLQKVWILILFLVENEIFAVVHSSLFMMYIIFN